jgi:hypothetical protein
MLRCSTPIAGVLVVALAASTVRAAEPAAPRSDDGSAELEALRSLGGGEALDVKAVEPTRGLELEYGVELGGSPAPDGGVQRPEGPQPEEPRFDDVIGQADLGIIRRQGTRKLKAGIFLSLFGFLFGPAFLAGAGSAARNDSTTAAIVFGVLGAGFMAMLGAGIPTWVKGSRMRKYPERYVVGAPRLRFAAGPGGFGLHF